MEVAMQDGVVKEEIAEIQGRSLQNRSEFIVGESYKKLVQNNNESHVVSGSSSSNNNTIRILTSPGSGGGGSSGGPTTVHYITTGGSSGGGIITSTTPVSTTLLAHSPPKSTMTKTTGLSIVHVSLPQSVVSTGGVLHSGSGSLQLPKGNVILLKPSSPLQGIQVVEATQLPISSTPTPPSSELNNTAPVPLSSAEKKRREILTRRPSYRKILNDLGGSEITGEKGESSCGGSESSQDVIDGEDYPHSSGVKGGDTITMTNAGTAGGTIVQYAQSQDGQSFFVPVGGDLQAYTLRPVSSSSNSPPGGTGHVPEEATRKREIRLLKNREAARECRRKKKEYIKCLENRVAVLENQNKALIDELKSLKELYCQQKIEIE